jgi:hypothetical protein
VKTETRVPLSRPYIGEREEELVLEVLRSGRLSLGPVIERFEQLIQEEMAKADKAIADGVSKKDFYDQVVVARGEKRVKGRFED